MKIKYRNFLSNNFFLLVLLFAVIIVVFLSYNRFIVRQDYVVAYESSCDPITQKCFVGCEDDACTTEYYYSKAIKYTPDLIKECGKNITDCETANVCLPEDRKCSITYCDPQIDGATCSTPPEVTNTPDNGQPNPTGENLLPSNNTNDINI